MIDVGRNDCKPHWQGPTALSDCTGRSHSLLQTEARSRLDLPVRARTDPGLRIAPSVI